MEILKGRGVHDYGILRALGGNAFWNFRRQGGGGLKHGSRPWLGIVIFLELPNHRRNSNTLIYTTFSESKINILDVDI